MGIKLVKGDRNIKRFEIFGFLFLIFEIKWLLLINLKKNADYFVKNTYFIKILDKV